MSDYTAENLTEHIRQHADVVRAHDTVHPDRSACGGVGRCLLMRAEHDAREEITYALERAARRRTGNQLVVTDSAVRS